MLEAAEIHRRVIAAGGPALLFTNVKGAAFPLVTNLFGTARRAELAFGARPLRVHQADRPPGRDAAAADAGEAVGRARRRRCDLLKVGTRAAGDRARSSRSSPATCGSIGCR